MLDLLIFIIFLAIVGVLVYRDRKNIQLAGIVLMRRTNKGKRFLDRTAKQRPRFWKTLAVIAVIIGIPAMIFGSYFLFSNSFSIVSGETREGVRLVLPWSGFETKPGLLLMPWWFWVIGVTFVIVPHEFFHGIICRLHNIRIKSIGVLLLVFIPGAFVEPDENQLKRMKRSVKLKVYAAGSFANFLFAALFWFLGFLLISNFFVVSGVVPSGVINNTPAAHVNMSGAIRVINGISITSPDNISEILNATPIGSNIIIKTTTGEYNITTIKHPELNKSFVGLAGPYYPYYEPTSKNYSAMLIFFRDLFFWIFLLSFGIGLINLLPIKPLDGGLIFEEITKKFVRNKKNVHLVVTSVSLFMLFLILFNLFGPMLV